MTTKPEGRIKDVAAGIVREYRSTMDSEVLHSWAGDAARCIDDLLAALEEAAGEIERQDSIIKNMGVASFCEAEEIAELMEAGARTWMPMELAKPERNGSIIVMTSDDTPVIGQAFWHEHGDGTWALHWSVVSPKEDCWNDPITETNKGIACWQPMPEGPCEARVKAMGSPGPHMAALLRIKELEDALRKIAEGNLGDRAWEANYDSIRQVAKAALSPVAEGAK